MSDASEKGPKAVIPVSGARRDGARDCPEAELWVRFAAGLARPDEQDRLFAHATTCSSCANRLRDIVDVTESESNSTQSGPADLEIETEAGRQRLASLMARPAPRASRTWLLAVAASVVVVLGAGALFLARRASLSPLRSKGSAGART